MKRISLIIFTLGMFLLGFTTPAFATRTLLPVTGYQQDVPGYSQTGWCWAACDKMIIQYVKNSSPSVATIGVNYQQTSDGGADMQTAQQALNAYNVSNSLNQYSGLTYLGVQSQIGNNRPIWCQLQEAEGWTYGHAVVIRGFDTSNSYVLYLDPSDGLGHGITYSNFCDGYKWDGQHSEWTGTIYDNH